MEMFKFDESFVAGVRRVMHETTLPSAPIKMPEPGLPPVSMPELDKHKRR